jgi:phenylalanyl-tRNA synthetase beta subunit
MIETTELLNFLYKAQQVSACGAVFRQTDEGYKITLYCDWHDDGNNYKQSIFIDNEGESTWNNGEDYDFYTMNDILDAMLEEQKQKEIKAQKRKELIARLTDEEKELLGLK